MAGPGFGNDNGNLAEGVEATHIGPETGDTARATAGEGSSAGTNNAQPTPPDAANIGRTNPAKPVEGEQRSFEGGSEGIPGTPSQAGAQEASDRLKDVSDG